MRNPENVFHLAIPCHDLEEAQKFYVDKLKCRLARRYEDRITLDFFGDQLVCHLSPDDVDREPRTYPRHFGITFRKRQDFEALIRLVQEQSLSFIREPHLRFDGLKEEHQTCFLADPSNNVLEFKYYFDPSMMY